MENASASMNPLTLLFNKDRKELRHRQTKLKEAIFYGFHDGVIEAALAVAEITGQSRETAEQKALTQTINQLQRQVKSLEMRLLVTGLDLFSFQRKFMAENANVRNIQKKLNKQDDELAMLSDKLNIAEKVWDDIWEKLVKANAGQSAARKELSIHLAHVHRQDGHIKSLQLHNQSLQADLIAARSGLACRHSILDQEAQCKEMGQQENDRSQEIPEHHPENLNGEGYSPASLVGFSSTE
ncbi:MAG: hypothetical protein Q9160_001061 [Pyrenula sp. 1 TL-2023]